MAGESGSDAKGGTRGRSTVKRLPAKIRDAVDAAVEDGATIDEITALIRERGGECSRSAVGRYVKVARDLVGEVREFGGFVEEWVRAREPGAEGRAGLVAIETLRMLMLHTMASPGRARGAGLARGALPPLAHAGPHRAGRQAAAGARARDGRGRRGDASGRAGSRHDP